MAKDVSIPSVHPQKSEIAAQNTLTNEKMPFANYKQTIKYKDSKLTVDV